jgi:predicted MFS family arabinose efflux permease
LIVAVGSAIQTAAINIRMFIAGHIIAGLAVGILLSVVQVYNAELATPTHRGVMVGLFAVMASVEVLCSNWVGYACFFAKGNAKWKIGLACQIPFAVILASGPQARA